MWGWALTIRIGLNNIIISPDSLLRLSYICNLKIMKKQGENSLKSCRVWWFYWTDNEILSLTLSVFKQSWEALLSIPGGCEGTLFICHSFHHCSSFFSVYILLGWRIVSKLVMDNCYSSALHNNALVLSVRFSNLSVVSAGQIMAWNMFPTDIEELSRKRRLGEGDKRQKRKEEEASSSLIGVSPTLHPDKNHDGFVLSLPKKMWNR